jgi:DAACS family dicarboxylate/amino acid:cation (Na+ or H+) symporter
LGPNRDSLLSDRKRLALHTKIFLGLLVGATAGVAANAVLGGDDPRVAWIIAYLTEPLGALFLRLLLLIVIPLVFSSLVLGVAGMGELREVGRVGIKTLGYTFVFSAISVLIGLGLATAIRPGERVPAATAAALEERYRSQAAETIESGTAQEEREVSPVMKIVETIVPSNPIAAVAGSTPNMLHLMFFSLLLGIGVVLVGGEAVSSLTRVLEGLYQATVRIIDLIMRLAPYAVAALLFTTTARFGFDLLQALAWFVATVLAGLAIHMFVSYSASVWFLARISPIEFFRRVRTAALTAFSTSSSSATLPTALRVSEENLGVPPEINRFVLTIGATANQNGTALYEGVTVLFLAQLAGVDLSLGQQVTVLYLAILGGIGTAGVPAGSIPFIVVVLVTIGVNPALIGVILGVDRILDMCRTTLNVVGDMAAAAYVARSEGHDLLARADEAGIYAGA